MSEDNIETRPRTSRHHVFAVKPSGEEGDPAKICIIGTAFKTSNGAINVQLDELPISGRFHISEQEISNGDD